MVLGARCVACGLTLGRPTHGPVCETCWEAVPWYAGPLCPTCGERCPAGARCSCEGRPPHLSAIASAARYEEPLRAIVHAFKYGGHQSLAGRLGEHLADHPHLHLAEVDLVVPVPLHPWRRFRRGFNQAERLARHLGPPVVHALSRLHWRPPQATLQQADQRRRNIRGAIALGPSLSSRGQQALRARLGGARVLLVDDVMTTGGTLSACAEVLRCAGVRDVRAATVARTPRPGTTPLR